MISSAEAAYIYEEGAQKLLIGTGQFDNVRLSSEAQKFFDSVHCQVELYATKQAIEIWNQISVQAIGLFHVTC